MTEQMLQKQKDRYQKTINKLESKSYRLTTIRKKIIELLAENNHISMSEIIEKLSQNNQNINIMSIYNTIDLLLKEDIIDSKTKIDKQVFFELSGNVIHVVCSNCRKWIHLSESEKHEQSFLNIEKLEQFLEENKQFDYSHFSLEVHSVCENCQKNK